MQCVVQGFGEVDSLDLVMETFSLEPTNEGCHRRCFWRYAMQVERRSTPLCFNVVVRQDAKTRHEELLCHITLEVRSLQASSRCITLY